MRSWDAQGGAPLPAGGPLPFDIVAFHQEVALDGTQGTGSTLLQTLFSENQQDDLTSVAGSGVWGKRAASGLKP